MGKTGFAAIPQRRQCHFILFFTTVFVLGQTSGKLDPVALMKDDISRIKTMMQAVGEQLERFNSLYQSKLENRLMDGATSIAHIDSNVKNLQERAHVWDTFKLHVSAWNDHIKALDTKLTTVNNGANKVDLAEEKIGALAPLESKMSKLTDRLTEADDKLSDIQKKLVVFPGITSTGIGATPLLTEFTSRGVLSSLKDIESKINRLVRLSANTNSTVARGRHLELQCPSQKVLSDKVNDMAGKIDYIHDRVDSSRQLRRRDGEDNLQDGGSLWRQMVYPLRRANRRLENIDKLFSQVQKLNSFSGLNNKDKATMASIKTNVAALQKCFSEQEQVMSDVARSTEDTITEARTGWQSECVSDARYNQRIQQFRNDLVQLLFETFKNHFDTNFEEMNQVCFGSKDKVNSENVTPDVSSDSVNNRSKTASETEMYAETKTVEEEPKINATDKLGPGCEELHASGNTENGLYLISQKRELNEAGRDYNMRYCDMVTEGGGWTVIQRRGDYGTPRQNFSLSWLQYKEGFGDLRKEFWFGNDYIHRLTNENDMILRIELWDFDDNFAYAEYETFRVDSEDEQYRLWIEGYQGNATDSLGSHNGYSFSTYDRDNDEAPPCCPCATTYGGGWWFYSCFEANLNGDYMEDPTDNDIFRGIIWEFWKGDYSLKRAEMKVRPRGYNPPVAAPAAAILSASTPVRSSGQTKP